MLSIQNRSYGPVAVVKAGANAQHTEQKLWTGTVVAVGKAGANAQHTEQKLWTGSGRESRS